MGSIKFHGFRGNIEFKNLDLFNYEKIENSSYKNKMFTDFFNDLKKNKLKSNYDVREYFLLYIQDIGDSIIHCQLARKRSSSLFELENLRIKELKNEDYPFVNVFIELKSQKFLIEYKNMVFDNPETCSKIIENIMKNDLKNQNAIIVINPITNESNFWDKINNQNVVKLTFNLNAPNYLDTNNFAEELMRELRRNTGADRTKIEFSSSEGTLNLNKNVIDTFFTYSSVGAGSWSAKYKDVENGETHTISSSKKGKLVSTSIHNLSLNDTIDAVEIKLIQDAFDKIEAIEKFKVEQ